MEGRTVIFEKLKGNGFYKSGYSQVTPIKLTHLQITSKLKKTESDYLEALKSSMKDNRILGPKLTMPEGK